MLGLPDGVRGCLFDLDGVLTKTAQIHDAAWKEMHHDPFGKFHIDGVTGPDEYSAIADDNVYTNLMARQNLEAAADVVRRYPHRALELGITMEEAASWPLTTVHMDDRAREAR